MNIEDVKLLSPLDRFCYWIRERESIRLKKEAGEDQHWTDDGILKKYRFTNVRRMDDKVSQWLLNNWYKPYFDHPNMLVACAVARFFNLPTSLEPITKYVFGKRWGVGPAKRIKEILRKRKTTGETVFNGAYMVRGMEAEDKIGSVLDAFIPPIAKIKTDRESMEELWTQLMDCYGWGSFMAGQVVADMRWAAKGQWADRNHWAPAGPGSMRGLNRIHERPIKTPMKQEAFLTELLELRDNCYSRVSPINLRMELHDWQNCLCEYDKYNRVLFYEGRPKSLYKAAT